MDEAVESLINTNSADNQPKWARLLAQRVLDVLREAGFSRLRAQVCVHNKTFGTAADIVGYCSKINKIVLVELKASRVVRTLTCNPAQLTRNCYSTVATSSKTSRKYTSSPPWCRRR